MNSAPSTGGTRGPGINRAEIERLRSRLLVQAVVLLVGVGAGAVALSYLGPSTAAPLRLTPSAARLGFLALLIGFAFLTLQRHRELRELGLQAERHESLLADVRAQLLAQERASDAYLQAANLVRSRFLQTVSHELRTPLTSILGYSLTLDKHWHRLGDQMKRECAHAIGEQGAKLGILVDRILEAARVELEGVTMKKVRHDVRGSAARALRYLSRDDVERVEVAHPARPLDAEIDPFVVEQAVLNCVDNSLRYTRGRVRVSLDQYRSSVRLVIADDGPGMNAAQLEQVTRPLAQPDSVRSGAGWGLHIVKTLVVDHGGKLQIRSGPEGTRVEISLPRWVEKPAPQPVSEGAR